MNSTMELESEKIIETITILEKRITERFPNAGLKKVSHAFLKTAQRSKQNIEWISTPNLTLRISTYLIIAIGLVGIIYSLSFVDFQVKKTFTDIVTISEPLFNIILLIGAAIYFLVSLESRLKTRRTLTSLNELRAIAHVIDMHQLTKDPYTNDLEELSTENSPKRNYTKFELQRYLDYCSEITALVGKVAALYSQSLPDEAVVNAANDIEILTTGLSRKIWQKLTIINESSSD